jgi:hypothetical protein
VREEYETVGAVSARAEGSTGLSVRARKGSEGVRAVVVSKSGKKSYRTRDGKCLYPEQRRGMKSVTLIPHG